MAKNKPADDSGSKKPWLFRSLEGKGNHLLTSAEKTDPATGKKVTTLKKVKPGNSNN